MNSITQEMQFRQSLMKYSEKYGVKELRENTTSVVLIFISGKLAGTEQLNPLQNNPNAHITTRTSTRLMS